MSLLEARGLAVEFPRRRGAAIRPVDGVSLSLGEGEALALVGESGCGKSLTALALLGLAPAPGTIAAGAVLLGGTDLLALPERGRRAFRGGRIGYVPQEAGGALDPVLALGTQLAEALAVHRALRGSGARARAAALLAEVGLPEPEAMLRRYPHELSGGMRQRALIALALAGEPEVLIADEPTTALDVTVQAQILELLGALRRSRGMGLLLVTHDLGLVAGYADRVAVMYAGRIVEEARVEGLFARPAHPYTRALLAAVPHIEGTLAPPRPIPGSVPDPAAWPDGCRFHPRCPDVLARCRAEPPVLAPLGRGPDGDPLLHRAACWVAERKR
ncbi:MAG TPA: ABC transporter ATP-binding protein [Gemmatimonadales bacterium]|nr:ABC transporter ATP-binding protein [Gemmatimonadales bacterium]